MANYNGTYFRHRCGHSCHRRADNGVSDRITLCASHGRGGGKDRQKNKQEILVDLQRRKDIKEDPCDSCDGTGKYEDGVCLDCLGQGVLLTRDEYVLLLRFAGPDEDDILGADTLY